MIYDDNFKDIDKRMSDSNIGARKNLEKAFDALWLDECLNDLYDTLSEGNRTDKIALLYKSSKDNFVAVNTAVGLTERVNLPKIVQQGGTWGPVLCSFQYSGYNWKGTGENYIIYAGKLLEFFLLPWLMT